MASAKVHPHDDADALGPSTAASLGASVCSLLACLLVFAALFFSMLLRASPDATEQAQDAAPGMMALAIVGAVATLAACLSVCGSACNSKCCCPVRPASRRNMMRGSLVLASFGLAAALASILASVALLGQEAEEVVAGDAPQAVMFTLPMSSRASSGGGNVTSNASDANTTDVSGSGASGSGSQATQEEPQEAEEETQQVACPFIRPEGETVPCPRGDLTLVVRGVRNEAAPMRILLFIDDDTWSSDSRYRGAQAAAMQTIDSPAAPVLTVNITGLLHYRYGIFVHHDTRTNGRLDTVPLVGIPREGVSATRGAQGGPGGGPQFRDAVFDFSAPSQTEECEMWYP